MIVHPFPQGSPAWHAARCGKITASAVERYFAPDKRALRMNRAGTGLSTGATTYLYELLAEWYFGVPADSGSSQFMRRGSAMEALARAAYELATMADVEECGFIESDCHQFGASVDGLVGEDGIVEIKVLGTREHLRVYHEGGERAYAQTQAQMADTGRKWADRFFWHPDPRLFVPPMRTERDEDFIVKLVGARTEVARRLDALQQRHIEAGFEPTTFDPSKWDASGEPVFDAEESAARIAELERKRAMHNA
ncbi:MAG: lambda exonuclease family protein [Planctomycetota bacterium]|jgi:exodeoxyribonuclease (lambda-induced)